MQKVNDIDVDLFRCFQFTGPCQSTLGTRSHIRISIAPPTTYRGGWGEKGSNLASSIWQKWPTQCNNKISRFYFILLRFPSPSNRDKKTMQCGCRYIHLKYFLLNKIIGFNECKRSPLHCIVLGGHFVDNKNGVQYHFKPSCINWDYKVFLLFLMNQFRCAESRFIERFYSNFFWNFVK